MTECSSEVQLRRDQWSAAGWLAEHELLTEAYWNEGREAAWVIGRPETFTHRCEIIAGIGGSLIVHGDFDMARFACYGDHSDAWSRLRWMADCMDVGYYVAQKASIGMRGHVDAFCYDEEVARYDLRRAIADFEREDMDPDASAFLTEALEYTEDEHTLREFIFNGDKGWDLWELTLGRVLRPHIVVSHVALNRTAWLLREKYGRDGPPICAERRLDWERKQAEQGAANV